MAIANSYPIDKDIENEDLFVGTKYSNRQTVNFPAKSIVDYVNNKGKISIAGQTNWKFVTTSPVQGSLSLIDLGGNNTPFSSITSLRMAVNDAGDQDVSIFFTYIIGAQIMISKQNEVNSFGHYKITSYTPAPLAGFYIIGLEYIGGTGNLTESTYYDISLFDPFPVQDKTYVYVKDTPSVLWVIEHNLDKFPSVTVVNNNNVTMYGEVIYIDSNNLQIEFSAGFSGKAYMN